MADRVSTSVQEYFNYGSDLQNMWARLGIKRLGSLLPRLTTGPLAETQFV